MSTTNSVCINNLTYVILLPSWALCKTKMIGELLLIVHLRLPPVPANKYKHHILMGLILQRAAPAVTRRKEKPAPAVTPGKEYDQTIFGHILSCGMQGTNRLLCL